MKIKRKNGFTIVELVIVIAVVAILAAILVPTISRLVKKAHVTSDTQLVRNLNTSLAMDTKVGEHVTMQSALEAAAAYGYDVGKINASATDNMILWDSVNDVFCYRMVDDEGNVSISYIPNSVEAGSELDPDSYKLWIISDQVHPKFSTYYTGSATVINTSKGFDAGTCETIQTINYTKDESAQDVVIRTNGGTLVINAKSDDVVHFGYADSVNVVDVATASYHENGEVKFLEVAAGHIVIEEKAEVSAVHFTATGEGAAAKFQNAEGKKISIDLSKVSEAAMPSFSRDPVAIEENGTYVAEVKTESTEYIWLFGQGIKEQMVVTANQGAIAENGNLKPTVETGAEDGSVADQIANPAKRNQQGQLVDSNDQVIDLETVDLTASDALDTLDVQTEEIPAKEDIQTGATLFGGGTGKESDPFLIVDYETFQHVTDVYEEGFYYFKVKDGVTVIDCKNWRPVYMNGSFEGNGVTLANLDESLFKYVGIEGNDTDVNTWTQQDVTISNMTVNFKAEGSMDSATGLVRNVYGNNTTTFKNVKTTGTLISGSNGAIFFCYTSGNDSGYNEAHSWATVPADLVQNIYITDCSVETTIYAPSGSVGIIGGHYCAIGSHLKVVVNNIDTIFSGRYYNKNGKYHLMYGAAYAVMEGSTADPGQLTCPKITDANITKGANYYTTTAVSNASYIKVYVAAQLSQSGTNLRGITMTLKELDTIENVSSGTTYDVLARFNSVNYATRQKEFDAFVSNGVLTAKVGSKANYDSGDIKLVVLQFNSAGELLASKSIAIANKANASAGWTVK